MGKVALITGVTGQDGSFLVELLLELGYQVHGIKRKSSQLNTERIDHVSEGVRPDGSLFQMHYGDLTDGAGLFELISRIRPDEIYNLGAQSHVGVSFQLPEYTAQVNAIGSLKLLEAVRASGLISSVKYYQASTSEMFGGMPGTSPQNETTAFHPRSPYAVSKLFAHWITVNYREAYGLFACSGILFNHESERRGITFVTRKITRGLGAVLSGRADCVCLGNLDAMRDWGHAEDYVKMQWLMLQQDEPDDYVIASGAFMSVRDFATMAARKLGIVVEWKGVGLNEVGVVIDLLSPKTNSIVVGQVLFRVDEKFFRPCEVETLIGDARKAHQKLGWSPSIDMDEMIERMIEVDCSSSNGI